VEDGSPVPHVGLAPFCRKNLDGKPFPDLRLSMLNHTDCPHPATKAARAACRKARAEAATSRANDIDLLLEVFASKAYTDKPGQWVWYAARRFADYQGDDLREAAAAILTYFQPSGDEARDDYRRRNGYTITSSPAHMLSITLRAAS
jgi:hypothetical protein